MYASVNFQTKEAPKAAIEAGEDIGVYCPWPEWPPPNNGKMYIEGLWYPDPYRWCATVLVKDGRITHVLN